MLLTTSMARSDIRANSEGGAGHAHAALGEGHAPVSATGIPNSKLGMWVFLASEVMFFTGLIAAYIVLRLSHPAWPGPEGHLSKTLGGLNTFLLLCSSATMVLAFVEAQRLPAQSAPGQAGERQGALRAYLFWTILLGVAFLGIKAYEYTVKLSHHITPGTNVFWSCYYTLTGFHGLHVLGGIVANSWLFFRALQGRINSASAYKLELAGLYWHFVDIVWIFLFPLLYLF